MNISDMTAALDECLLTDDEIAQGEAAWQDYYDPFPEWRFAEREESEEEA